MDELELLKKNWNNQEGTLPKLSYDQIYKMILKKSSSVVKWIFIISILEFILWLSIDIGFRISGKTEELEALGTPGLNLITSIVSYSILIFFMVRFYLNYKKIKATDSTKELMKNILKTRKTVKVYVLINVSFVALMTIGLLFYQAMFTTTHIEMAQEQQLPLYISILGALFAIIVSIGIILLFYRLIYGILIGKLKDNYKELQKLEK